MNINDGIKEIVKNIRKSSLLIVKKLSSTTNLFSDNIGNTKIKTATVGVMINNETLFLYSISSSFLIR